MDEMMQEHPWKVLVRTNIDGNVVDINSSAFVQDTDGWVEIDSGYGDRYHHAQGNYLLFPLVDDRGVYRYKLEDGEVVERTVEEMDADWLEPVEKPVENTDAQTDQNERLKALEETMAACAAAYREGVNEA